MIIFILAFSVILITGYPVYTRIRDKTFDIFEPIVPSAVMLSLLFGVRPIAMFLSGEISHYRWHNISDHLPEAVLLGLIGCAAFVTSYEYSITANRQRNALSNKKVKYEITSTTLFIVLVAVVLGLSIFLYLFYLSFSGSLAEAFYLKLQGASRELDSKIGFKSEYLSSAPILSTSVALLIIAVCAPRGLTKIQKVIVVMCVAYPTTIFLLGGDRRYAIPSAVIPIVAYLLIRQKRPSLKQLLILSPILLLFLAALPFSRTQEGRAEFGGLKQLSYYVITNPVKILNNFITGPDAEMVSALAVEIKVLRQSKEFSYGNATVGDLLLAPIPSTLFPNKPLTARNELLIKTFGGPCNAYYGGLCPDFSIIGTFYQDFWYIGVIFGMVLTGLGTGVIWRWYLVSKDSPYAVVLASSWSVFLPIIIRAGFMPAFAWSLYFIIPSLFLLWLSALKSPRVLFR